MGWNGGEFIEGTTCEDAPCCGCCGPNQEVITIIDFDDDLDLWFPEEEDA